MRLRRLISRPYKCKQSLLLQTIGTRQVAAKSIGGNLPHRHLRSHCLATPSTAVRTRAATPQQPLLPLSATDIVSNGKRCLATLFAFVAPGPFDQVDDRSEGLTESQETRDDAMRGRGVLRRAAPDA